MRVVRRLECLANFDKIYVLNKLELNYRIIFAPIVFLSLAAHSCQGVIN